MAKQTAQQILDEMERRMKSETNLEHMSLSFAAACGAAKALSDLGLIEQKTFLAYGDRLLMYRQTVEQILTGDT